MLLFLFLGMIQYNPKAWFSLIFKFHKSDTFRKLIPAMLSVGGYAALVAYIELEVLELRFKSTPALHASLGMVISLLLVFRTNTAYERWWEGRKIWGSLVNHSRNLCIKLKTMVEGVEQEKELIKLIKSYPIVLKEHLRDRVTDLAPADVHQPNYLTIELGKWIQKFYKSGKISGEQLIILHQDISALSDICGGCERIRKTPIPYSYSLFLKKFIFAYIMTMPFGFIRDFGYGIIPAVVFFFYVLASLELIAEEIEDPFGEDANDLPTDEIALTIEKSVNQILK